MKPEWPLVKIEDVCCLIVDCVNKTAPVSAQPTPFRMIRTTNVRDGRIDLTDCKFVDEETYRKWTRRADLRTGDVILTREAPIGQVGCVPDQEGLFLGQRLMQYRADPEKLDHRYLLYSFLSPQLQHQFGSHEGSGSVVSHIRVGDCFKFELRLAPLLVQRRIGDVLEALDAKIDLNRRINQTLEAMAQAIFQSWFVDFDPVKAKIAAKAEGRDPLRAAMSAISGKVDTELDTLPLEQYERLAATAALFPDEMEVSELGEIPMGWSASKVEMLLSRLSAKTRYTKEQVSQYGQIPVFEQGASVLLGYHQGAAAYQASAVNPMFIFGDHTCITRLSYQPFDISQNVLPLQGKDRATAWVYYAVKEKQKFQEYRRHWMELISKDVVIAAADICLEFSKIISNLHLQIEANERQMQSLQELRDTLLPKLLSGELSVADAMVETEA